MGLHQAEDSAKDACIVQPNPKQAKEGRVKDSLKNPVKKSELIGQNVKMNEAEKIKGKVESPVLPRVCKTRNKSNIRAKHLSLEQGFEPMEELCSTQQNSPLETASAISFETPKPQSNLALYTAKQAGVS